MTPARWSGITETGIGLEVEVEAGLVLKCQAPHLLIRLAHDNQLRRNNRRDLEIQGEFIFVPDFPVGGFKGLAVESNSVRVVGPS